MWSCLPIQLKSHKRIEKETPVEGDSAIASRTYGYQPPRRVGVDPRDGAVVEERGRHRTDRANHLALETQHAALARGGQIRSSVRWREDAIGPRAIPMPIGMATKLFWHQLITEA